MNLYKATSGWCSVLYLHDIMCHKSDKLHYIQKLLKFIIKIRMDLNKMKQVCLTFCTYKNCSKHLFSRCDDDILYYIWKKGRYHYISSFINPIYIFRNLINSMIVNCYVKYSILIWICDTNDTYLSTALCEYVQMHDCYYPNVPIIIFHRGSF